MNTMSPDNSLFTYYAQGARCGYPDGKARCGYYVIGEEVLLSYDAADAQGYGEGDHNLAATAWAWGYRLGYRTGASGDELAQDIGDAPLPPLPMASKMRKENGGTL